VSNRWLRFVIALLAFAAAGAAGFRVFQHEQERERLAALQRTADQAAASALTSVVEIKAALHAYTAAGQGDAFWTARSAELLDALRGATVELDREASRMALAPLDTLDLTDRLAAAEERAKRYVRVGQNLLAGEVIFTEARDLLASLRDQVAGTRAQIDQAATKELARLRQEQLAMALGGAGVLGLAVLILIATGRAPEAPEPIVAPAAPALTLDRLVTAQAIEQPPVDLTPPVPIPEPTAVPLTPAAISRLNEAAAVCVDLARASSGQDVSALLERAAAVLNASGIIVWMISSDGRELVPAAAAGYDERLFRRIPSIPPDAANLTAAAFRATASRTSAATGNAAAALAVPLMAPNGAVGVFSAELRRVDDVDEQQLSIATIFAAQLSTLVSAMAPAVEEPRQAQAQA
jgi:hypothetical protein